MFRKIMFVIAIMAMIVLSIDRIVLADDANEVERVISKYGKSKIIYLIHERNNNGGVTIIVDGKAQRSIGTPRDEFVTTQTILYDLNKLGIAPQTLEELILKREKAIEKQHQANASKRKAEEEKRSKLEKEREEKRVKLEKEQNEAKKLEEQERIKKELETKLKEQQRLKEFSETEANNEKIKKPEKPNLKADISSCQKLYLQEIKLLNYIVYLNKLSDKYFEKMIKSEVSDEKKLYKETVDRCSASLKKYNDYYDELRSQGKKLGCK